MSKSLKDANWGCGGAACILLSIGILVMYLVQDGFHTREGKFLKQSAGCAYAMSAFFFLMGVVSIAASIALRGKRKSKPPEVSRWRRRIR